MSDTNTTLKNVTYKISEQDKDYFIAILILDNMINQHHYYPILNTTYLDSSLTKLMAADRIKIEKDEYVPTEKGRDFLKQFLDKYFEYVKIYDVYCAVDTEAGEFAFSEYYDYHTGENDEELEAEKWNDFISAENFLDLRIAVAEFKKLNPIEIVFMSFINENRFKTETDGWEFDVFSGLFWDEIVDIVNNSLTYKMVDDAGHDMEQIVEVGTNTLLELHAIEEEIAAEEAAEYADDEDDEYDEEIDYVEHVEMIEEPVYTTAYLESYYDPFYVSPLWDPYYDPYYY